MPTPSPKRILIVTACFGEGHNSAARNLALALEEHGHIAITEDPCLLGAPHATRALRALYLAATTHSPKTWLALYRSTDRVDFNKRFPFMRQPELLLGQLVRDTRSDAVVCTYPLYPYFLDRLFAAGLPRLPVFTVVTDSITINASWLRSKPDHWLVTDRHTREAMIAAGLDADRVVETGFPVHPSFARLPTIPADDPADPFRILYFPTSKRPHVRRIGSALLEAGGARAQLTIVLGRNFRKLYQKARQLEEAFPAQVVIKGWTQRVPELMCKHHLVVGKAGGATVHEALAARCPMLVHHLVPGQEEGNLRLLERFGAGSLAVSQDEIRTAVRDLLADNAANWRRMKHSLATLTHRTGSSAAASFITTHC